MYFLILNLVRLSLFVTISNTLIAPPPPTSCPPTIRALYWNQTVLNHFNPFKYELKKIPSVTFSWWNLIAVGSLIPSANFFFTGIQMAKFTGGAVPLIVGLHDISTHSGLLHHINICYTGTQSHTVQAGGAQMQFMCYKAKIYSPRCVVSGPVSVI